MTLRFRGHGGAHVSPHGKRVIRSGDLLFVDLLYECGLEQVVGTYARSVTQLGHGFLWQGHPSNVKGTVATKRSKSLQGIDGALTYF